MKIKKSTIFISLLLSLLYFRTFIWLFNSWLTDPYYSHGFLTPIISGFIVWRNIRKNKKGKGEGEGDEFKLNPENETESETDLKPEPFKFEPGISLFAFGLIIYTIAFIKLFPFLSPRCIRRVLS